jgi:hypothetical protein
MSGVLDRMEEEGFLTDTRSASPGVQFQSHAAVSSVAPRSLPYSTLVARAVGQFSDSGTFASADGTVSGAFSLFSVLFHCVSHARSCFRGAYWVLFLRQGRPIHSPFPSPMRWSRLHKRRETLPECIVVWHMSWLLSISAR